LQTFLPYPDYYSSAEALDYQRLGKQRVEAKQIINAIDGLSKGWTNHPVTQMWQGHVFQLANYGKVICEEWISRGYQDTLLDFFREIMVRELQASNTRSKPTWFGDPRIHISHQSNLIRKDPEHYAPIFGHNISDLPYVYPDYVITTSPTIKIGSTTWSI